MGGKWGGKWGGVYGDTVANGKQCGSCERGNGGLSGSQTENCENWTLAVGICKCWTGKKLIESAAGTTGLSNAGVAIQPSNYIPH